MFEQEWIHLDNIKFIRNRRLILDQINWKIRKAEHWLMLGANGSGKTTLLQLMAGYLWPTEGRITVLGERFGNVDLRELRKKIGWAGSFLQAQIPPEQRPLDLIVSGKFASIGIFEKPSEQDYSQARELAEQLKCEHILNSPYAVLSQGEKQRLLIGRALINRPSLLILDEPCAGLDLPAREQLLGLLEELGRSSASPTMIFVTHHLEEVMPAFTHTFLLKAGRCLAQGAKESILRSELLSEAFETAIEVVEEDQRYWARARSKR